MSALELFPACCTASTGLGCELEPRFIELGRANLALWQQRYGHTPGYGQGALVQGDSRELHKVLAEVACVVSSPPYANGLGKEDTYADHAKREKDSHRSIMREKGIVDPFYGQHPAQLGNLPPGSVADAILSSPPYANGCAHTGGADSQPQHIQGGVLQYVTYGTEPAQLGTMPPGGHRGGH